jgi:hypothetical protein
MKNLTKIKYSGLLYGFIFAVVMFSFCFGYNVKATNQVDVSHTCTGSSSSGRQYNFWAFQPNVDSINSMEFTSYSLINSDITLYLCKGNINSSDYSANHACANGELIYSDTITVDNSSATHLFDFGQSFEMTIGDNYFFETYGTSYLTSPLFCSASPYTVFSYNPGYTDVYAFTDIRPAFNTYYDDEYVPVIPWTITPITPLSNAVIASSTTNFVVTYTKPSSTSIDDYVDFVLYDNNDNQLFKNTVNVTSTSGYAYISLGLPDGLYNWSASLYCKAYYWNTCDNTLVSTDTQYFKVSKNFINPDNICNDIATSTIMGEINCALRQSLYWAFYPGNGSLESLDNSYTSLKDSFPFNAFFGLTDALTDGISSSTPNSTGTLQMPFINTSGHYVMITVLNASSTPNLIGQTNTTLFRNSIAWFLWLATAFLIFLTFKRI